MTLGNSWSLHSELDESITPHHRYSWCLHYLLNVWSEVRMNEWSKLCSCWRRLSSCGPLCLALIFLEFLMSSRWFRSLMAYEWIIWKMLCLICNILCALCKMLCVLCNMISMMMHVTLMAWLSLSKFGKLTNILNPNLASPLTWLSLIMW